MSKKKKVERCECERKRNKEEEARLLVLSPTLWPPLTSEALDMSQRRRQRRRQRRATSEALAVQVQYL